MSQAKRWVFTINNYSDEDVARLNALGDTVTYLVYGDEVGENGTPHLQGFVIFDRSTRFNLAKERIGANAHIEVTRGTSEQAANYCKKDGSFTEYGSLPQSQGKRSDWDKYREWVLELGRRPTRRELASTFPSLYARYSRKCFEIADAFLPAPRLVDQPPRVGWQEDLRNSIGDCGSAPPRQIAFVVDPHGGGGKSWFCQYCLSMFPERTQVLRIGKRDDLAYAIDESKDIFLVDVPRNQMTFLQYSVLEMLKDQMVFSPKYESTFKILRFKPYVIVLCNEAPDMNELTADRYNIINI